MKSNYLKLLLLLSSILFTNNTLSQSVGDKIILKSYCEVIGPVYSVVKETTAMTKDSTAKTKETSANTKRVEYLEPDIIFIINSIEKDTVSLTAINFNPQSKKDSTAGKIDKSVYYNNKLYKISRTGFDRSHEIYNEKERMSIGLLTLPFKARPQDDFSFDTEFNLSTTLNVRLRDIMGTSLNAQLGAGIGSVNLNSSNANGVEAGKEQDVATLNFFTGFMLQYKRVQAGIYVGVDQINNQSEYQWKHNGNLWFGFGIGFNVFQISLGEEKNQKQN